MKEKMTSGEIAKQAEVSTKALRIYDEKGLLKPVGHSEGNYKLYDKSSLIILEKIIALKHIGFSLEEIKSSLENDEQNSIREILEKQLEMMNQKIYELQKAAKCIESALARFDENPDWDDIADIIRKMEMSQGADERRWSELTPEDFSRSFSKERGYAPSHEYMAFERPEYEYRISEEAVDTEGVTYLEKTVEELQQHGIQVVFVHSPEVNSEEKQARINAASVTAEKYNVPFIDFTVMEDCVVDYATDLSDADHANIQGATKLTHYLGEYLMQNYDLTSHAGDEAYHDWDVSYEQFKADNDSVPMTEVQPD